MKPIIMSTENVKAILDGRKTQTRRVMKLQPLNPLWTGKRWVESGCDDTVHFELTSRWGVGDKLWVRETWRVADGKEYTLTVPEWEGGQNQSHIEYKANDPHPENAKWRPSIFMPRWASRITLEITGVRVEQVQTITERDAIAEGVNSKDENPSAVRLPCVAGNAFRFAFRCLWNRLNKKRGFGWSVNPWVWVIDFTSTQTS